MTDLQNFSCQPNGRRRIYVSNIQSASGPKLTDLGNRVARDVDFLILNETNTHTGGEEALKLGTFKSCAIKCYENKKSGFGTAVLSKKFNPECDSIFTTKKMQEIVGIICKVNDTCTMAVIGMYRSPSQRATQRKEFYDELDITINEHLCNQKHDIIIVAGDDNSSNKKGIPFKSLLSIREKYGGFLLINEPTRGKNQPDHVLAFYDPLRFTIEGTVIPGVADHSAMVIDISAPNIMNLKPSWLTRTFITHEDTDGITSEMKSSFTGHDWLGWQNISWDQVQLDRYMSWLMTNVSQTRFEYQERTTKTLPEDKKAMSKSARRAQYALNKVLKAAKLCKEYPQNIGYKENLIEKQDLYTTTCQETCFELIEKDMANMKKFAKVDARRFFQLTSKYLKFEGLQKPMSVEEKRQKISEAEKNYVGVGQTMTCEHMQKIIPNIEINWKLDQEFIAKRIRSLKKVDAFFKRHAESLAKPLEIVMRVITQYNIFPNNLKIPNLALLPNRTIFYLDFWAKIVEDIINWNIKMAMPPESEGQMAYQRNRSTELCVAIGLHRQEEAVLRGQSRNIQVDFDCKKAFDTCYWKTILEKIQLEVGCGKLIKSYLENRSFKFEGKLGFRDQKMGRGSPPGTILGPILFGIFQSTDIAMNLSNTPFLWPGKFSDDKSPLGTWECYKNGHFQKGLDGTWAWRGHNHIEYHITGKKRPMYYIFRTKSDKTDNKIFEPELFMGGNQIERGYEKKQLGISMRFFKDNEESNDKGYKLEWKTNTPLSMFAQRFQSMKHMWSPESLRTAVQSYVIGNINYATAMYWLRSDYHSINRVRFDYAMSIAAVVGMTTPELIGMSCCKNQSLSSESINFKILCKFLNLPTIKDIAIMSARRLVNQWSEYEPDLFIWRRSRVKSIVSVKALPKSLLYDIFNLSKMSTNDWYPEYSLAKLSHNLRNVPDELWPEYLTILKKCRSETEEQHRLIYNSDPTETQCLYSFWLYCKAKFNVLEPSDRAKKHLELKRKNALTEADITPPEKRPGNHRDLRPQKRIKVRSERVKITCETMRPKRGGKEAKFPCRICGYAIGFAQSNTAVKMPCCESKCHLECWVSQGSNGDPLCAHIKNLLKKDRRTIQKVTGVSSEKRSEDKHVFECLLCDQEIDLASNEAKHKHHLIDECLGITKHHKRKRGDDRLIYRLVHLGFIMNPTTWTVDKRRKLNDGSGFRGTPAYVHAGADFRSAPECPRGVG